MIDLRRRWGQWRVYYFTQEGCTTYMLASWTDAGAKDSFVQQAQGRAVARIEDLLELIKMTQDAVKEIKPHM